MSEMTEMQVIRKRQQTRTIDWLSSVLRPHQHSIGYMGWLGDSSHRGQGCQAWTAVGLLPRYPRKPGQSAC